MGWTGADSHISSHQNVKTGAKPDYCERPLTFGRGRKAPLRPGRRTAIRSAENHAEVGHEWGADIHRYGSNSGSAHPT